MSCKKCDEFQESNKTIFYRWKNSNMEIRGCDEHVLEVFKVLDKAKETKPVKDFDLPGFIKVAKKSNKRLRL